MYVAGNHLRSAIDAGRSLCTSRGRPCNALPYTSIQSYVTQQLQQDPRWPVTSEHGLTPTTCYRNDFCKLQGTQQISNACKLWHNRALRDLPDVEWAASSAAPCLHDANSVRFTCTVRWVPPSIQWLVRDSMHGANIQHNSTGGSCPRRTRVAARIRRNLVAVRPHSLLFLGKSMGAVCHSSAHRRGASPHRSHSSNHASHLLQGRIRLNSAHHCCRHTCRRPRAAL